MKNMHRTGFVEGPSVAPALPDESSWIAEWCQAGCTTALDRLLRANSLAIRAMARGWSRDAHRQDDLVSEGTIALIACLDGYRPHEGVPFFAYARPFVRAAMRRCYYLDAAIVAVPLHHIRALREGRGSNLDRALVRAATHPEPLDGPEAAPLGDDLETAEAALIRHESDSARRLLLEEALSSLSESEQLCIRRRAGSDGGPEGTQRTGLNQTQNRKIEARALARLRAQLILRGVTSASMGGLQ